MNNFTPQLILDEIKSLISYSITNKEVNYLQFQEFHSAIVRRYFDAKDIEIDYKAQTIDLKLPMANNNFTAITFECLDLDNFLQSCLKSDKSSIYFYQELLTDHDIVVAA